MQIRQIMHTKLFITVFAAVLCAGIVFAFLAWLAHRPMLVTENKSKQIGFKAELDRQKHKSPSL